MTVHDAEAAAIYRLLRHATNILGYTIVDRNHQTLQQIVQEINRYNTEINDLQICTEKASHLTTWICDEITESHHRFLHHAPAPTIPDLTGALEQLLETFPKHCAAAASAYTQFIKAKVIKIEQQKVLTNS